MVFKLEDEAQEPTSKLGEIWDDATLWGVT